MAQVFSGYVLNSVGSLDGWQLVQREVPELTETQVLVKMECSTVNPSDYLAILGKYPTPALPMYSGLEGSGTVVKVGNGDRAQALLHKRVAVASLGAWSEYNVADVGGVFPLEDHVSFEQAADFIVNPMTVACLIEIAQSKNSAFVSNASASALGQQLTQLAARLGIKHINIVRRQEQVEILRRLGAEHVFNSSEPGWLEEAKKVAKEIAPKVAFDAIGGKDTVALADLIENGGTVYNYGLLSGENAQLSSAHLIFQQKTLTGFWLSAQLYRRSVEEKLKLSKTVQDNIDILANTYNVETDLNGLREAMVNYMKSATGNKILIRTRV